MFYIISEQQFCRCETFNSFIRVQNIFGNKGAPSRDIACHFATIEHLRYICDGGCTGNGERYHFYQVAMCPVNF